MKNHRKSLTGLSIFLFGIIAYLLMIWITPFGSGVSPDSTVYIGGAQNLLTGRGFSLNDNPITHFPPFYSLFLAIGGVLQSDFVQIARHLNAVIFGINAAMIALAVYLATKRNLAASIIAACFFLSSAPLLELHAWAWSEPLFITFTLSCILLLSRHIVQPDGRFFVASALSLALAITTRYAGLGFLPPALILLVIVSREKSIWSRFCAAFYWFILAITPLGIWLIRNMQAGGTATNRALVYVPADAFPYGYRIYTMLHSFFIPVPLPEGIRPLIAAIFIVVFIILFVFLSRRLRGYTEWRRMEVVLSGTSLLFAGGYIVFLFFSITFFDPSTPVDWRIFSPVLTILILGLFSGMWAISQGFEKSSVVHRVFLLFVLISILLKTPDAIRSARFIQQNGLGYTSGQWQQSESIAFVRSLPDDVEIYSNGNDVVEFLTGKNAFSLPRKTDAVTSIENEDFIDEIYSLCKDIKEKKGLLIYLSNIPWRQYLPAEVEIAETCNFTGIMYLRDGTVYGERR